MTAPCKNCQEREVGCHGKCDRYKEYRHIMDMNIEKRITERTNKFSRAKQEFRRKGALRKKEGLR